MARVSFTSNLQRHLSAPPVDVAGTTLAAVLDATFDRNPRLRHYLLDDQGRVRKHVRIFINDRQLADRITLSDAVAADDEVFVFQALSGG